MLSGSSAFRLLDEIHGRNNRVIDGITQSIFPPSAAGSLNYVFPPGRPSVRQIRAFLKRSHIGWLWAIRHLGSRIVGTWDGSTSTGRHQQHSMTRQRWEETGDLGVFWLSMVLIGPKQCHVIFVIVFVPRRTVPAHVFGLPPTCPPIPLPRQNKLAGRADKVDECCSGRVMICTKRTKNKQHFCMDRHDPKAKRKAGNSIIVKKNIT